MTSIRALLLAAGYGTRLEREIRADESGEFENLVGVSKALVPVGESDVVTQWLNHFLKAGLNIDDLYLVTNNVHFDQFKTWAEKNNFPLNHIFNDKSTSNETRLGAVGDIYFTLLQINGGEKFAEITHPLMVVAGDTLFTKDFDLKIVVDKYHSLAEQYETNQSFAVVLCYQLENHNEVAKRGIVELNDANVVTSFLEKPDPSDTESNNAVPAFYIYSPACISLLDDFLSETTELKQRDAPGTFLQWLLAIDKAIVHAVPISGRYDIGGLKDLITARKLLASSSNQE